MAYIGATPWHGLGQKLPEGATIDDWKIAAGLDWFIQKRPMFYGIENPDGSREPRVIENQFAHVRSDTQEIIGTGSKRFQLLQPGDTLEFYRDLVEGSRFHIETAGSLHGGAKVWALARADVSLTLGGEDTINPYLLLATANDGSMATAADFTSVRVVCQNTLSMAVGHNGGKARIRVPHSRQFDANAVKAELGLLDDRLETFARDADAMTQARLSDDDAIEFFVNLIARKDKRGNIENERTVKTVTRELIASFRKGPGAELDTARGTVWGAVNAVTHHVDFQKRARSTENRFSSGQFGTGAAMKSQAFANALELIAA
jgi:phage/plasmid-like protein (TIGR03299 family)